MHSHIYFLHVFNIFIHICHNIIVDPWWCKYEEALH